MRLFFSFIVFKFWFHCRAFAFAVFHTPLLLVSHLFKIAIFHNEQKHTLWVSDTQIYNIYTTSAWNIDKFNALSSTILCEGYFNGFQRFLPAALWWLHYLHHFLFAPSFPLLFFASFYKLTNPSDRISEIKKKR